MKRVEHALASGGGLIKVSDHRALRSTLYRMVESGDLQRILPGVLAPAGPVDVGLWLRALCLACPAGVLHDETAASLWLGAPVARTHLCLPTGSAPPRGVVMTRRRVPPEFILRRHGLTLVTAAYAAVELAARDDGRMIAECLRRRLITTEELPPALAALAGTVRQQQRARVVRLAIRNPWSYAELLLQRILLRAGIDGWEANAPVRVAGVRYWVDLLFETQRIVIEIDGFEVHSRQPQFTVDRERQNALVNARYRVYRFTWEHLTGNPDYVVSVVRAALRAEHV